MGRWLPARLDIGRNFCRSGLQVAGRHPSPFPYATCGPQPTTNTKPAAARAAGNDPEPNDEALAKSSTPAHLPPAFSGGPLMHVNRLAKAVGLSAKRWKATFKILHPKSGRQKTPRASQPTRLIKRRASDHGSRHNGTDPRTLLALFRPASKRRSKRQQLTPEKGDVGRADISHCEQERRCRILIPAKAPCVTFPVSVLASPAATYAAVLVRMKFRHIRRLDHRSRRRLAAKRAERKRRRRSKSPQSRSDSALRRFPDLPDL